MAEKIRVLLVDDEASVRRGLRMQLELQDDIVVVGEAGDGAAALALAPQVMPDLVLMDLLMRPVDGLTATAALLEANPALAVIMLTLHDDAATRREARAAGVHTLIGKHEPPGRLLAAIRRAVGDGEGG